MPSGPHSLAEYDYSLPRELIAQRPLSRRADARLLVVDRAGGSLSHRFVRDLPELLRPGDCLVLNDSRVIPARLIGKRTATGGRWEGLFLAEGPENTWKLLGKSRGKIAPGETVTLLDKQGREDITLGLLTKLEEGAWIARPSAGETTLETLHRVGRVPLPPYIRSGEMEEADRERYQTVYASRSGSIAAPTAGLHFTPALLEALEECGVHQARLTLHVGLGTFRPIQSEDLNEHAMHGEWGEITSQAAGRVQQAKSAGGRVVAVGTTSLRLLETAAGRGPLGPFSGETNLFIKPGHSFRAADALMTNFHLPRTTLLVLVRAFGGDELMQAAYEEAVRRQYRFYSYGDAMLIV